MSQRAYYEYRLKPVAIKLIFLIVLFGIILKRHPESSVTEYIIPFVIAYGAISAYVAFAFAVKSWKYGIIFLTIIILLVCFNFDKLPGWLTFILVACFMFGGVFHDIYFLVKWIICILKPKETDCWQEYNEVNYSDSSSGSLKVYMDEYNCRVRTCHQLFDEMSQIIEQEHCNPDEAISLSEKYKSICKIVSSSVDNISKNGNISEAEMRNYIKRIHACCVDLQNIQEQQLQYIAAAKASNPRQHRDQKNDSQSKSPTSPSIFFNGCDDLDSLNKRYRDLCKVYHPDMGNGSTDVFQKLNAEYEMLKRQMK